MSKDFGNAFGGVKLPQQPSAGGNGGGNNFPQVDYDKVNEAVLKAMGGEGKELRIGVVSNIYDLGTQAQDEQMIPLSDKDYTKHEWRLEKYEDGNPKDPTAKIEERWYKKQKQECLVYTPPPVKQVAITVDLPEIMFDYSVYTGADEPSLKPYRIILGKEGFIPKGRTDAAGTYNLIAKPFKLSHTNVNRGIEGAQPHYAMAKIGKIYKMAEFAGVLDENENFHAEEVGKLIGKALMVEVETTIQKWNDKTTGEEKSKLVVDAKVTGKLGPRDVPFYESELLPKLTDDLFGFVIFDEENDEETLKKVNAAVINTMKLSPEFEGSKLQKQLLKVGKIKDPNVEAQQKASAPVKSAPPKQEDLKAESKPEPAPTYNEPPMEFCDDIPFIDPYRRTLKITHCM